MKKTIWGHTIVKNEERFLWFAVTSVIDFVDKILLWDTGSTDKTLDIINVLKKKYPQKIDFREYGTVDPETFTKARQEMLDETESDWFLILDGDELWWESSIKKIVETVHKQGDKLYAVVTPVVNVIGDIYHFQEEQAGQYQILGRKGHLNIRTINRKIPGLHIKDHYPLEGFYDEGENLIQEMDQKLKFVDAPLLHFTHMNRSSNSLDQKTAGRRKIKYELGIPFAANFKFPEVLYLERPTLVPSPWIKMSKRYRLRSFVETPLKRVKRRLS